MVSMHCCLLSSISSSTQDLWGTTIWYIQEHCTVVSGKHVQKVDSWVRNVTKVRWISVPVFYVIAAATLPLSKSLCFCCVPHSYLMFRHFLNALKADIHWTSLDEVGGNISIRCDVAVQLSRPIGEVALSTKFRPLLGVHVNNFHGWLCDAKNTHTHTTILRLSRFCPGQPMWASTRRNIQQVTPIMVINHPLAAASIHYYPCASSLFNLRAWRSFSTISLQVFFDLLLGMALCTS